MRYFTAFMEDLLRPDQVELLEKLFLVCGNLEESVLIVYKFSKWNY